MPDGHIIVLGYGDMGKRIVEILEKEKAVFIVVDTNEKAFKNAGFEYIVGNATEEEVLKKAGIGNASTVIVTLNNDTSVIFATLMSRGMNSLAAIFARANSVDSIDKIYKAGADYVASLSIVAGQILAKITTTCSHIDCDKVKEDILLYEGIEIEKYPVSSDSAMIGKKAAEIEFIRKAGCRIIGIKRGNEVYVDVSGTELLEGDVIAVAGTRDNVGRLKQDYMTRE
jgi:Trk K+ transport system NAD-binding subunit